MAESEYDQECHQQRQKTHPPRINRDTLPQTAAHWLDSEGKREMAPLGEGGVMVWREDARWRDGRFVAEADNAD